MRQRKQLNIKIGERVKLARERAGYTQEKFAEVIEVSVQYISDLERGVTGAAVPTMIRICETLHVSCDYILLGREETNDISAVTEQMKYLSEDQLRLVERAINLMLEAMHLPGEE